MMLARTLGVAALALVVTAARAQTDYSSQTQFHGVMKALGKGMKGPEDYEESILPPGGNVILNGPLLPGVPNGPFLNGLDEPNLAVYSHVSPNPAVFSPRNVNDLLHSTLGGPNPYLSHVVLTQVLGDSLDLVIQNGTHTGVGFKVVSEHATIGMVISVFDTHNAPVAQYFRNGNPTGTNFFGVQFAPGIGRINISSGSNETLRIGADDIESWAFPVPAPASIAMLAVGAPLLTRRRRVA